MAHLLLIEDDPELSARLTRVLNAEGFEVEVVAEGAAGLAAFKAHAPDLVILNLILPTLSGFDVLKAIREFDRATPVIIISSLPEEADRLTCFHMGASDYVMKPLAYMELIARIRVHLRGEQPAEAGVIRESRVTLDPAKRLFLVDQESLDFTPKEFDLIHALIRARGAVLSHEQLLLEVWKVAIPIHTRTVETHVKQLRRKLEPYGLDTAIVTIHGRGYAWRPANTETN